MHVVLIQPPALLCRDAFLSVMPPLGLAYLAARLRADGHRVEVLDAVGAALHRKRRWPRSGFMLHGLSLEEVVARIPAEAEVVGVSMMFTQAWPMYRELVQRIRRARPRARIVAGGEHASALWERVLAEGPVDVVVHGEGEESFAELLARGMDEVNLSGIAGLCWRAEGGRPTRNPRRARIREIDALPLPDWSGIPVEEYMAAGLFQGPSSGRSLPMLATRGCPYACTFCAAPEMWTRAYRVRSPARIVDEMELWMDRFGATDFQFQDLTATIRRGWVQELAEEILCRGLDITWSMPAGTRSESVDAGLARAMVASGCHHITFAPESGSPRILRAVKKKVRLERMDEAVRAALEAGMVVCLFLVIGFPQETEEDLRLTLGFARRMARLGVQEIAVNTFAPLPGTELFAELRAERGLVADDAFCYAMATANRLFHVRSWNAGLSRHALLGHKLRILADFYARAYARRPMRLGGILRAALGGPQRTKVERVARTLVGRLGRGGRGGV